MKQNKSFSPWINTSTGADAVDFQRAAQITWWSILQGIAVGAFVSKMPNVLSLMFEHGQWYLLIYAVTTIFIIILVWVQMAWAILIARWQLTLTHTTIILFLGVSVSLLSYQVDMPLYWLIGSGFFILCGIAVYAYNYQYRTFLRLDHERVKNIAGLYLIFLVLCMAAFLNVYFYETALVKTFWGIVFLVSVLISMKIQQIQMEYERSARKIP